MNLIFKYKDIKFSWIFLVYIILNSSSCFIEDSYIEITSKNPSLTEVIKTLFSLGQDSETIASPISGLNCPSQIAVSGTKLFVADSCNNRVLIWNNHTGITPTTAPDLVLGQPDKGQLSYRTGSARDFTPFGITTDGTRLFVSEISRNRILIWNTIPTSDYTPADIVLGQPDFTSTSPATTQSGLNSPYEIFYAGGKLLVGDYSNRRVMIWTSAIVSNGQPADLVLGKSDFTSSGGGTTSSITSGTDGVWTDGTKVLIVDYSNHRALGWNTFPTTNGQAADFVLGQPNFTTGGSNTGGLSASSMSYPWDIKSDGTRIVVADNDNHRILVWTTWPTGNNIPADIILGQPNAVSNSANQGLPTPTAQTFYYPEEVFVTSTELFVSDTSNNRILTFDLNTLATNAAATRVIGQRAMDENTVSLQASGTTANSLSYPTGGASDGIHYAVSDCGNNRVLVWNSIPTTNSAADIVIGQPDMSSYKPNAGGTVSAATLNCPSAVAFSDGKLFIADKNNNRIVVFNQLPTVNGSSADLVLGQPNLTSNTANNGGASASTLNGPTGLFFHNGRLAVSDTANNRVLIWNSTPSSTAAAADLVLGQTTMSAVAGNSGGLSATSLYAPEGNPASDGTNLILTDTANNRVLIWNTWPTSSGQAADIVVGQPTMLNNQGSMHSFIIDAKITDNLPHQVALYALDWDATARGMRVDVLDENGNILDSQSLSSYQNGIYLVWNIKGAVKFRIQRLTSSSATISGIFFDPVATGSVPSGNVGANFVGQDTLTQGTWHGKYGVDGYKLALSATSLPSYTSAIEVKYMSEYTWAGTTSDVRGMQNADASNRMATCWYTNWGGKPDSKSLYYPTSASVQGGRMIIAERYNNRLMVWNSVPTVNGQSANHVFGQTDFFTNDAAYAEQGFNAPIGLTAVDNKFIVVDSSNNRLMWYKTEFFSLFTP